MTSWGYWKLTASALPCNLERLNARNSSNSSKMARWESAPLSGRLVDLDLDSHRRFYLAWPS
jgi:hypothetical protein